MPEEIKQPEIFVDDIDTSADTVNPTPSDVQVSREQLWRAFNQVAEEKDALKEENSNLRQKLKTAETLDKLMEPSAAKAFNYMFIYSASVGAIILMNGFGCFQNELDNEVLKFLVGSTAATVIGLVGMVLTGVFIGARK